jgi:hypothetical protein
VYDNAFQSSLHRGRSADAVGMSRRSYEKAKFQSSLHRGRSADINMANGDLECLEGFNPLFIEAGRPTSRQLVCKT